MALADNLVGYWSAWQGSSGYRLLDRSGRGNHGTLTGMDAGDWVGTSIAGSSGYVLDFDGTNDAVSLANFSMSNLLNATSNTIAMWVYPKTTTANGVRYIGFGSAGSTFSFRTNFQNLEFAYGGASGVLSTVFTTATYADKWTFILGTSTPTSAAIFINGRQVASRTDTVNMTLTTGGGIGYRFSVNSEYAPIRVAEAAVWGRSVFAAEVADLYTRRPGWYQQAKRRRSAFVAAAGFKAYWARRQSQVIGGGL